MGLLWREAPRALAPGEGGGLWVCVGGVEWGGAGKTPVALWAASRAAAAGAEVAFVSHGYRGAARRPERVPRLGLAGGGLDAAGVGARALARWGDEALMARAVLPPSVSVWAGGAWEERVAAARGAARVVVCDGGLYREDVPRHLSLAVVGLGGGGWPLGRSRPAWAFPRGCAWWAHDGWGAGAGGSPSPALEGVLAWSGEGGGGGGEGGGERWGARAGGPLPARCAPLVGWSAYEACGVLSPEGERLPPSCLRGVAVEPWVGVARPGRFLALLARLGARVGAPVCALNHRGFRRPGGAGGAVRVCTLKDLPRLPRGGGFFGVEVGLVGAWGGGGA